VYKCRLPLIRTVLYNEYLQKAIFFYWKARNGKLKKKIYNSTF